MAKYYWLLLMKKKNSDEFILKPIITYHLEFVVKVL